MTFLNLKWFYTKTDQAADLMTIHTDCVIFNTFVQSDTHTIYR